MFQRRCCTWNIAAEKRPGAGKLLGGAVCKGEDVFPLFVVLPRRRLRYQPISTAISIMIICARKSMAKSLANHFSHKS